MPFFFERFAIVAAYHAEHPDDLSGTEDELAAFDSALHDRFNELLDPMIEEFKLPATSDVRSMVVLLATLSSGARAKTQLRNACEYYASARPSLPLTVRAVQPRKERRGAPRKS
jgi:hypothetical protein